MSRKAFGRNPAGERLRRIRQSPRYHDNSFRNIEPTEVTREGASYTKMLCEYFSKPASTQPTVLPATRKSDLRTLSDETPNIVWFGHSSYFISSKGFTILVDPVLFGTAAPVRFLGKPFKGSSIYQPEDLPPIDLLVLTHDHYDHLDYQTIIRIRNKVKRVVTPLGVGAHLEYWGVPSGNITELDWWEGTNITDDIGITATPARHFSGRTLRRSTTLWASYVLQLHGYRLFLGGDSGYDRQFAVIGEQCGPFDLALLECGQYGADWPYIHMMPEQTAQATIDLKAKVLLPVHWARFVLANHPWDEPIARLLKKTEELHVRTTTPMIGEAVVLDKSYPESHWWRPES